MMRLFTFINTHHVISSCPPLKYQLIYQDQALMAAHIANLRPSSHKMLLLGPHLPLIHLSEELRSVLDRGESRKSPQRSPSPRFTSPPTARTGGTALSVREHAIIPFGQSVGVELIGESLESTQDFRCESNARCEELQVGLFDFGERVRMQTERREGL
jgi:hypothetical protein